MKFVVANSGVVIRHGYSFDLVQRRKQLSMRVKNFRVRLSIAWFDLEQRKAHN